MKDSHLGDDLFGEEPDEPPPTNRRARRRRREAEAARVERAPGPPRRSRRLVSLGVALAVVIGGGAAAVSSLGLSVPSLDLGGDNADYEGNGEGSVEVRVESGDTGLEIGSRLEQAGVVKSGSTFAQLFGSDPDASKLQPGTYTLRKQMSSSAALTLMLSPGARSGDRVTIPEGLWASEVYSRLSKATRVPVADYRKVKLAELGLPEAAHGRVEGYLFPSTYEFDRGTPAKTQLARMVSEFKRRVSPLDIKADQLSRVVTVASIVQAESRLGQDGPKVARVVENRLRPSGETRGRLQMDSTVHFVLQKRGTVTTTAQERQNRSPYNTYLHAGLPPGPINSPGLDAIKAAANPAPGPWMYFVTVNQSTGETRFATNRGDHDKNVQAFRAWCRANPGKC